MIWTLEECHPIDGMNLFVFAIHCCAIYRAVNLAICSIPPIAVPMWYSDHEVISYGL